MNTCPYQEWYKFTECTIESCKNFTKATKTRCLGIDRVVPVGNKIISDAELNLYKCSGSVSTRLVSMRRKRAIDRVKHVLALHKFIDYIKLTKRQGQEVFNTKQIERLELSFPLKLRRLHFHNWMWPHLTDPELWSKFVQSNSGECKDFPMHVILNMTEEKYKALQARIKSLQGEIQ